jgi:hypothetical protein
MRRPQHACLAFAAAILIAASASGAVAGPSYSWRKADLVPQAETLEARIAPPPGFARVPVAPESWAAWLRGLPLKSAGAPVLLYTGARKWRQDVHAAVVDIDVGSRDLQQCADAIMRLRAEWLYSGKRTRDIGFNYTDGKRHAFAARGKTDYAAFRKYMDQVFAYAGTYSLERELKPVAVADMQIGDVFIKGGFNGTGHAVLVADMVESKATGERRFLLLQSYMPAQEMHVLKNPAAADGSPWYPAAFEGALVTPEWTFARVALRRWP